LKTLKSLLAVKNLEKASVIDPEPTVSTPDLSTTGAELALYRYLVGDKNLALTKKFLEQAKNGKSASAGMIQAYMPAIKMLDDIPKNVIYGDFIEVDIKKNIKQ